MPSKKIEGKFEGTVEVSPGTVSNDLVRAMRVLIVEDNADQAESLKRILESRTEIDYTPEVVRNLADATKRLDQGGIDAVLLDLRLPDAPQDLEAGVRLIANQYPDVGIVAMTGWSGPEIEGPVKQAGADEVLLKGTATAVDVSTKLQHVVIYRRYNRRKAEYEKMLSEFAAQLVKLGDEKSAERSTRPNK